MKDKMSNKELMEMLSSLGVGEGKKDAGKIFEKLSAGSFGDTLDSLFDTELSDADIAEEIFCELVNEYLGLLGIIGIESFSLFKFPHNEDCRRISVDEKEFDLDSDFCEDVSVSEKLCAIDCLMADLREEDTAQTLEKLEKRINERNSVQ